MRKPGQFRDITALEALRDGEREAMEGLGGAALAMHQVAGTIDARFASIEARLKALEERNEPQARNEPDEGIPSLERDDPAV
jgi:hypothetical protein